VLLCICKDQDGEVGGETPLMPRPFIEMLKRVEVSREKMLKNTVDKDIAHVPVSRSREAANHFCTAAFALAFDSQCSSPSQTSSTTLRGKPMAEHSLLSRVDNKSVD
jgi:hypothetical protein